ncbi:class I SAM-dependent methyltransferase [Candidatus Persebacteraceae bacterium Df01]|uniref:Class I SAM-dependent methyltransferase n=1 Tax=Candidatus Doriopsillibacter californiensis TaxID=2970740 RepID=A0ABT7QJA4_9GAMM|nr:class I SAM-dependent methyltransferase [Candidatus Persebacteraceae bacterium Df01]
MLNTLLAQYNITDIIDFGCGDGNQISMLRGIDSYLGIDVSAEAIKLCQQWCKNIANPRWMLLSDYRSETAEAALSLDVIYHLVEESIYEQHLHLLFGAAQQLVVIYGEDKDLIPTTKHILHRKFTDWIKQYYPQWCLANTITVPQTNTSFYLLRAHLPAFVKTFTPLTGRRLG